MTNHLYDGLLAAGRATPAKPFAILPDGRRFSHGDVETVSARLAHGLVAAGLQPGDRVAVQVEKSIEALMLYLATVRAGGVFLPLNPAYTAAEIDYFLSDSTPRLFFADPRRAAALAPIAAKAGARLETLAADGACSLADRKSTRLNSSHR